MRFAPSPPPELAALTRDEGARSYRRLYYIVGLMCGFTALLWNSNNQYTVPKLESDVVFLVSRSVQGIPSGYTFPENNYTSVLDGPLALLAERSNMATGIVWGAFALLMLSFLLEIGFSRLAEEPSTTRRGLKTAQNLGFAAVVVAFIALLVESLPSYVQSLAAVYAEVPECAPELYEVVRELLQDFLGLAIGSFLAANLAVSAVLITIPGLMRACIFNLHTELMLLKKDSLFEPRASMRETQKRIDNIIICYKNLPLLSPPVVYMPLFLVSQYVARPYCSALIVVQFIAPTVFARVGVDSEWFMSNFKNFGRHLLAWLWTYYAPLGVIIVVEGVNTGNWGSIIGFTIQDPIWWITCVALVLFALVLVSDLLFMFLAYEEELEEDRIINAFLDAVREQAAVDARGAAVYKKASQDFE